MPYKMVPGFCPVTGLAISQNGHPTGRFKEITAKLNNGGLVKFGVESSVNFDDIDKVKLLKALKDCKTLSDDVESIDCCEDEITAAELMFKVMQGHCMACGREIKNGQGWYYANGILRHEMCKK